MDFRRKANPWAREIQEKPSQPERSGGLILDMAHRKVAGRGEAAKSRSASGTYVGSFCRNGLSPQGEPMGNRNQRETEPTQTVRRADFGYGTSQGRRSRRGREVPLGKRDLRRSILPEWTFAARRTRWAREIQGKPSQPERSSGLILNMAPCKVAGRGGAAKSNSASWTYKTLVFGAVETVT